MCTSGSGISNIYVRPTSMRHRDTALTFSTLSHFRSIVFINTTWAIVALTLSKGARSTCICVVALNLVAYDGTPSGPAESFTTHSRLHL